MKRLVEAGLMYGNLVHVTSSVLVERYNRALAHLIGKTTALSDFHIDISGFSPEIGAEMDDDLYLNHQGVNRQFILLSTEQKRAPLLNSQFSMSRGILRQFIDANEAQLFALTAKDAVAGELVNSVYDISTPEALFDLRGIEIEADTTKGTLRDADALAALVERFRVQEDAWLDDVLIAKMISLAKRTGDITRNPVRLKHMRFAQENFWTAHFGGLYLFRSVAQPALITNGSLAQGDLPIDDVIPLSAPNRIARFLEQNGLTESIVDARGIDTGAILRQKMDFILVDVAAQLGVDLTGATRSELRRVARQNKARLPEVFHGLAALLNWAENDGRWPKITSNHPAYFYTLRAVNTPDRDLVNMLLAELTPLDVRQLFICHKQLFYQHYRKWEDAKQSYVVDFLRREYQVDKAGAREALFGHDASMDEASPAPDVLIERVGPWGAVKRG